MLSATGPVGGWGLGANGTTSAGALPGAVPRDASGTPTGDKTWSRGFLYSPALTVGGGTSEVQRNIVAEKVLGLPRDA
jgi:alkylation response protein AidB-like acyl-CoA dehydrogenase